MIVLPSNPGVVIVGSLLRDPGEGPWGEGAPHGPSLPPGTNRPCALCADTGWLNDPFCGASLGVPCFACGGV